jgi:threonine synthase
MTATAGMLSRQVCLGCGEEWPETDAAVRCRACGGLLEIRHRQPEVAGQALRQRFDSADRWTARAGDPLSGVWRYRELVLPTATEVVSYPEGNTPLLQRDTVAEWAGVGALLLKHEGMNPTGSFKDRGMTVAVTQAHRIGVRGLICASTGNTSASLAAYGAQAGLPVFVLIPAGLIARGKLAQAVGFGARVLAVRGNFDDCMRLVEEAGSQLGLYLVNSINPFRIEGQKTIIFELLQQLGWRAPDWIAVPGGNLGNTAAFGKALEEAMQLGLCDRMPRLAVVQAEGAAPFARGYAEGFGERHRVVAETVATAIRIGNPASWDRAVGAIRTTNGVVLSVPDNEILAAKRVLDRGGVGCEPASGAAVAGLRRLVASGTVSAGQRVVAVLTGHMLKDTEILLDSASGPSVGEIDASLSALARAIE